MKTGDIGYFKSGSSNTMCCRNPIGIPLFVSAGDNKLQVVFEMPDIETCHVATRLFANINQMLLLFLNGIGDCYLQ